MQIATAREIAEMIRDRIEASGSGHNVHSITVKPDATKEHGWSALFVTFPAGVHPESLSQLKEDAQAEFQLADNGQQTAVTVHC